MLSSNPPPQSAHVECPLIIIDPILPPHTLLYLRPSLAQTGFHLSLLCHVNLFSCGRLSSPASFLGHGFLPSLNFSSQSRESGARCELVSYHGLVLISHSLYSCVDIPSFLFASLSPLLCFAAPCFLSQSQVGVASFCLPYSLTSKEHPPFMPTDAAFPLPNIRSPVIVLLLPVLSLSLSFSRCPYSLTLFPLPLPLSVATTTASQH